MKKGSEEVPRAGEGLVRDGGDRTGWHARHPDPTPYRSCRHEIPTDRKLAPLEPSRSGHVAGHSPFRSHDANHVHAIQRTLSLQATPDRPIDRTCSLASPSTRLGKEGTMGALQNSRWTCTLDRPCHVAPENLDDMDKT